MTPDPQPNHPEAPDTSGAFDFKGVNMTAESGTDLVFWAVEVAALEGKLEQARAEYEAAINAGASEFNGANVTDLLTPCCGVPIYAYVGGFSEEVEIYCWGENGCGASWSKDGKRD